MSPAVADSLARFTAASRVPTPTISVPLACDSIFAAAAPMVYTRFTRSFSRVVQHAVVAALVLAAEDEVNAARETIPAP